MKKILLLGDSYASECYENTWPYYLERLANSDITGAAFAGSSNYHILEQFKKFNDETFDYIIVVLTTDKRIPKVEGYPYLSAYLPDHPHFENFNNFPDGFVEAYKHYMKYFFDEQLLKLVSRAVIKEIQDNLYPNQKVIWIDGLLKIDENNLRRLFEKGILINGTLTYVSFDVEIKETFDLDPMKLMRELGHDPRTNHLSDCNQELLARFLANIINKDGENLTDDEKDLFKVKWINDPEKIYPYLFKKK